MDDEKKAHDAQVREMVMSVALALCAAVIEKAEDAELAQAHLAEDVDAAGVTWSMRAIYYGEPQTCGLTAGITSAPEQAHGAEGIEVAEGVLMFTHADLLRAFGIGQGQQVALQFVAPVAWIKLAYAHTQSVERAKQAM